MSVDDLEFGVIMDYASTCKMTIYDAKFYLIF